MTKRDKIVIISASLLAFCVIASAGWFAADSSKNIGKADTESIVYFGVAVVLGIFSVLIVYLSKVRKNKFEKMLTGEYLTEYEVIKDAILNSHLSDVSKKETIDDILDILIEAQGSGKAVAGVIGNSASFSKKIISEFLSPGRHMVLNLLDGIKAFSLFVIGITAALWLEQVGTNIFQVGMDTSMVLFVFLIAFLIIPATKKLTSTRSPWMFFIPLSAGILYVLTAIVLRKYCYDFQGVKLLLDGSITMIPNITVFMVYILIVPVLKKLKTYLRQQPYRNSMQ